MVMMNLSTLAQYLDNMPRHHFLFRMIAPCLLLAGAAFPLNAQSCSATINPGYCADCYLDAYIVALGCVVCNGPGLILGLGYSQLAAETGAYSGWKQVFNGNDSDAIVAVTSQLAGQSPGNNVDTYPPLIHSTGLLITVTVPIINQKVNLGLLGPAELDLQNSPIPGRILDLLLEPISGTGLFQPIPR